MASWQYKPTLKTTEGYHVNFPDKAATKSNCTGYLKDQDEQMFPLWIHEIQGSFEVNGQNAQGAFGRTWFPRFMAQPRLVISGQAATQAEYGQLAEFVRVSQEKSLRFRTIAHDLNTVTLVIPGQEGMSTRTGTRYSRTPIHVKGHVKSIDRHTERFVNAPPYQFEFVVAFSYAGLYKIGQSEIDKLAKWMDIVESQGTFAPDPDYQFVPRADVPPDTSGPEGSPH
jgi:hypothetical protein